MYCWKTTGPGTGPAGAPLPLGPDGHSDRFGLHRSVAKLLVRIATAGGGTGHRTGRPLGRGLVVTLDDLHGADPASLELLDHLVRHPPHALS